MSIFVLTGLALFWLGLYVIVRRRSVTDPRWGFIAEVIAATGLLALVTVGFFWRILFTEAWMPAGGGDLAPFLYPNYHFAAEHLRQGTIPLWNPHLYSGTPFAADIQTGLFYPINLLVFLLVPALTYEWLEYLAIFHFWLAGATMYVCLRRLILDGDQNTVSNQGNTLHPLAAFFGAVAFEFSDLFIVHFGNLNMIAVAAWLPLIFLLFQHSLHKGSYGLAAAGGAVLAIATLAGHIQITLFILLTLGLYTLWYLRFTIYDLRFTIFKASFPKFSTTSRRQQTTDNGRRAIFHEFRPLFLLLTTLLITITLSALLLFPAYQMSQHTPRAELPYAEAAQYSLHPVQLVGLLIPNYFGRDPALHWGPWERVETGYIGLITLLLALIGSVLSRWKEKFFFVGLALVALLLALGGYSILHGWLYATLPGFDQLRAPARFIFLLDFGLAVLAALGLNHLLRPLDDRQRATLHALLKPLTWGLGGLIVVAAPLSYYALLVTQDRNLAIFNRAIGAATGVATFAIFAVAALVVLHLARRLWLREARLGVTLICLLLLDLFTLGTNVDVGTTDPTAAFEHPEALAFLAADEGLYRTEVTTDIWHLWQPNTALLHGFDDVWGLYNPLTLADTTLYWSGAPPRDTGRYNFLGIKYIIASKAGAPADGDIIPVFDGDPEVNIYLNQKAQARATLVGQAVVAPDQAAAWEAIRAADFDPTSTVILESGRPLDTTPTGSLAILGYDLHSVTLAVESDQPGYLVLADAYYPGWRATLDGQPVPIHRANYAFRAVYVPAGQHTVRFLFNPLIWWVGLGTSGVTLVVLVGWGLRTLRYRQFQDLNDSNVG